MAFGARRYKTSSRDSRESSRERLIRILSIRCTHEGIGCETNEVVVACEWRSSKAGEGKEAGNGEEWRWDGMYQVISDLVPISGLQNGPSR